MATRAARRAFEAAPAEPAWLEPEDLDRLQGTYPARTGYSYDPGALERRGHTRAAQVLTTAPRSATLRSALEIGCGDGMVSAGLAEAGIDTIAADLDPHLFDPRARRAGVRFLEADATSLPLEDGAVDLAVSYNAFEHFPDPDAVLSELTRVVRVGGLVYVDFGPLWMSALGLHAYRAVTIPFCQHLFPRDALEQYARERDLGAVPFDDVNGWTLERFRSLWRAHSGRLRALSYAEVPHVLGFELVERHPACFKSKTSSFDELCIGTVRALFERTA